MFSIQRRQLQLHRERAGRERPRVDRNREEHEVGLASAMSDGERSVEGVQQLPSRLQLDASASRRQADSESGMTCPFGLGSDAQSSSKKRRCMTSSSL